MSKRPCTTVPTRLFTGALDGPGSAFDVKPWTDQHSLGPVSKVLFKPES